MCLDNSIFDGIRWVPVNILWTKEYWHYHFFSNSSQIYLNFLISLFVHHQVYKTMSLSWQFIYTLIYFILYYHENIQYIELHFYCVYTNICLSMRLFLYSLYLNVQLRIFGLFTFFWRMWSISLWTTRGGVTPNERRVQRDVTHVLWKIFRHRQGLAKL